MVEMALKNIHKKYDNNDAYSVTDFNLDIADREFIVFVGPSGCGKSTTLRMIAGLEDISEGELSIGGKVMNDVAPKDRDIAMVFQNYALYPHMTVFNNMAFGLKLRKYDKEEIKKRVENAAEILGLTEYLDRKPAALSGGQRQRIVIAIALICYPEVLIADEPTTALDVTIQAQILELLKDLQEKISTSIIFITHDLGVVANVADRVAVMYGGRLVEVGTAEEIFYNPQHPYTWGLLGSMPTMEGTEDKLYAIPGSPPDLLDPPTGDAFYPRNEFALKIDTEKEPPYFEVSPTHKAATWLLAPQAPKVTPPAEIVRRWAIYAERQKNPGGSN